MFFQAEYSLNMLAAERKPFTIELIFILLWVPWILWQKGFSGGYCLRWRCLRRARQAS